MRNVNIFPFELTAFLLSHGLSSLFVHNDQRKNNRPTTFQDQKGQWYIMGISIVKADMKVLYHWKRQSYVFLANFCLKQGISSEYVMVDFICIGLPRPVRNANRKIQNENFLHTVGFKPRTFRLRSERAKRWVIRAKSRKYQGVFEVKSRVKT